MRTRNDTIVVYICIYFLFFLITYIVSNVNVLWIELFQLLCIQNIVFFFRYHSINFPMQRKYSFPRRIFIFIHLFLSCSPTPTSQFSEWKTSINFGFRRTKVFWCFFFYFFISFFSSFLPFCFPSPPTKWEFQWME